MTLEAVSCFGSLAFKPHPQLVFLRLVSLCFISEETLKASGILEQQDASASYHLVGSNGTRDMTGSTSTLQVLLCCCPSPEPPWNARQQLLKSRRVRRAEKD